MTRLPFFFIITGIIGFILFQMMSLFSYSTWFIEGVRGPGGWVHIHLFVLGWGTMLAMGAVYQLINVILQSKLYSESMGYVHYVLFTIGLTGLLYGFGTAKTSWIAIFAILTLSGIIVFAWNIARSLLKARKWDAVTISAGLAVLYLLLTGLSGMAMGVNFALGAWNELHERLFGAHIWLGTIGWFGLLITGFSYKMFPMFYLAHHYPIRLQSVILALWNAGVMIGAAAFLLDSSFWIKWIALLFITIALAVYIFHLRQIELKRHKKSPGLGIKWTVYANYALFILSLLFVIYSFIYPHNLLHARSVLLAGWVYLGGWVSFTILCYASKIIPFLWWTLKYGNHAGKPGTPVMSQLLDEKKVNVGLWCIAILLLIVFASIALNLPTVIAVSGSLLSLVSVLYIALLTLVFTH